MGLCLQHVSTCTFLCVCVLVCETERLINKLFQKAYYDQILFSFFFCPPALFSLQAAWCLEQMRSSSWMRSERPVIKVRPRRFSRRGHHSTGHHVTRQFSSSTKESRHLTFVRSTACSSLEAWTDSYACGTHIFLGEERLNTQFLFLQIINSALDPAFVFF